MTASPRPASTSTATPRRPRRPLGPEAWELVRADRPPPSDRHGPGATLADVQSAVASIEQIGAAR